MMFDVTQGYENFHLDKRDSVRQVIFMPYSYFHLTTNLSAYSAHTILRTQQIWCTDPSSEEKNGSPRSRKKNYSVRCAHPTQHACPCVATTAGGPILPWFTVCLVEGWVGWVGSNPVFWVGLNSSQCLVALLILGTDSTHLVFGRRS
jgi:hypothetical protein